MKKTNITQSFLSVSSSVLFAYSTLLYKILITHLSSVPPRLVWNLHNFWKLIVKFKFYFVLTDNWYLLQVIASYEDFKSNYHSKYE